MNADRHPKRICTNLAILNDEAIVNTRLEHLKHLRVLHIIADVFKDVAVGDYTQGTEDDPDGDVDLDVRDSRLHDISQLHGEQAMSLRADKAVTRLLTERSWFL